GVTTEESGPVFAGGEWNVKGGNYCNDIGGPLPKYLDHSGGGSNISGDYGYYVHDIILSCRNQGHGGLIKDDNFMIFARRGGQDNSHWSNGGGFTKTDLHIDVNGIYYFD